MFLRQILRIERKFSVFLFITQFVREPKFLIICGIDVEKIHLQNRVFIKMIPYFAKIVLKQIKTNDMTINLSDTDSIANKYISELRDVNTQKDRMRFRSNLERLGSVFAYEISKKLKYKEEKVETPLGIAETRLPKERIVLATILRAGLPLHQGLLHTFDAAENAFVSAYRMHHKDGTFEINIEYVSCPNLEDATLIVSDSMLATGASMAKTAEKLLEFGKPKKIHFVAAIASTYGLEHVKRLYPKATIWIGAEDEELTARSFIVPGLGDAGDLAFGDKLQE